MDKQFFFLAGLPRSGGTLLSSLLSQNPDVYVSPQSVLPNTLGAAYNQYQSKENKDSDQFQSIYNVMEMIIPTFYGSRPESYIVDKNFTWLDPHQYVILEHHLKNPIKIICPMRDVLGILASWNRLCEKDPNNAYDKEIKRNFRDKRLMADRRAQYFMELGKDENGGIAHNIENHKRVLYPEFKDNILLVDYDYLTLNTEDTMNEIYAFLDIPSFKHSFTELDTPHKFNDTWGIKDHHKVKSTIKREEYVYSDIFSADTIKKYSGLEFWK